MQVKEDSVVRPDADGPSIDPSLNPDGTPAGDDDGDGEFHVKVRKLEIPVRPRGVLAE